MQFLAPGQRDRGFCLQIPLPSVALMIKNREFPESEVLGDNITAVDGLMTNAVGPAGSLPLTEEMLRDWPSGDIFGLTQNAGMGWPRDRDARPAIRPAQHAGRHSRRRWHADRPGLSHRALGSRAARAGRGARIETAGGVPFAGYCSDPCDGRTQGTTGMFDSLPYRNDAAIVFRRLIRSLPTRQRRAGRRHLRQGAAGDDAGPGRRRAICRACWCRAA